MASSEPTPIAGAAARLVSAARGAIAWRRRRAVLAAVVAGAAALAVGLTVGDALLALGGGARMALGAGACAALAVAAGGLVLGGRWLRPDDAAAARAVEDALGDHERRLTAA